MSVKEQIDRIEAAKSSLKTAIEGKGVTVPSTTKIDGYGALVESIPAGVDTSDGTLYPAGMLKGMVGYSKGQKVTGEMQNFTRYVFDGSSSNLQYDGIPAGDVSAMLPRAQSIEFQAENVIFPVRIGGQATTPAVSLEPGVTTFPVVSVTVPKSKFVETFGDATPADVVKDKLFMGAEGYAYGTLEVPEAPKETWVLNDTINTTTAFSFSASFTSNGVSYTSLETGSALPVGHVVRYVNSSGYEIVYDPDAGRWRNQAYRKLIFDSAPSGDLLTWLQANGVKQPADVAVQDSKEITIITNGSTTINPDVPYDALKSVKVITNIPQRLVPANLTIQSQSYSGEVHFNLAYYSPDGTIKTIRSSAANTLPFTIQTVVNSGVILNPSGWSGIPHIMDGGGCLTDTYQSMFYIVPTANEAYIDIEDIDA